MVAFMLEIIFNPKIFNYIIMALYLTNAGWWVYNGSKADMFYWLSALAITATVTWGYQR
jgi:hypothetical protein